ncbi:hypothetical protein C8Q76DRAFT_803162 [Earliella scabrosa]|nr:hypothetical protein C8Q76DRAFT_803162 [Earliella scabrosa]
MPPSKPDVLFRISASGRDGVRLQDCVNRSEETGLKYLDNFDDAWRNVNRRLPSHGVVKLHGVKLRSGDDDIPTFAHYLELPERDKPLLLGHVVMQLANALLREHQALVCNTMVQGKLQGRSYTSEQARFRAGLPKLEDVYITAIMRLDMGQEEWWYPKIVFRR